MSLSSTSFARGHRRALRRALIHAPLLLALAGCFEDPVAETITLQFLAGRHLVLTVRTKIHEPDPSPPGLQRRLAETRRAIVEGSDAWNARFAAMTPAAERFSWQKALGEITGATRAALIDEPDDLPRFFADTQVAVAWREDERTGELRVSVGAANRATAKERERMERALGDWSAALAEYFALAHTLYDDLEKHPDRAEACLGRLLRDDLPDERASRLPAVTAEEDERLEALRDAMTRVSQVLLVDEHEAQSLEELSHRVYDPFPARLQARVPGRILEIEGFVAAANGALEVPGLGLWPALTALHGRWLQPDPLLAQIEHQRNPAQPLDVDRFLAAARHSATPGADEVRAGLLSSLRPLPSYRVVWSTEGLAPEDEKALRRAWRDEP